MDKEIYGYIYKITNTKNGKVYIGLTTIGFNKRYNAKGEDIERVYNYYVKQRKHGQFYNIHLLRSIEKYGFEVFEVIKEFDIAYSKEELKEKERYWIGCYKCNDINYGYNRTEGGDSYLAGKDNPLYKERKIFKCGYCGEEIERLESCIKGYKNTFCNKECCSKWLSEHFKGREVSEETKKKLSEANKGKRFSEEHRRNLSESQKGKEISEKTRKKIGEAQKGAKNNQAKLVVCIFPDGRIIKDVCMKELAKELGISICTTRKILKSKKPYKTPINSSGLSKEKFEHLKTLEGIRIMYYEDYLKEQN